MSLNLYTYVKNNPLKYVDPTGHIPAYGAYAENDPNLTYQGVMLDANGYYTGESTGSYHDLLDLVGLIPVIGEFADGANAIAYLIEGDYAYALLSSGSMVPIAGWASTGTKVTVKAGDKISDVSKARVLDNASVFKAACNCFVGGTKVQTDEGEKDIEDIEVGDMVLAKDENNPVGELAYKEVTGLYRNQRDDIIKLYVGDQVIETTDNHPFWVEGKGWIFADELGAGDKLQKADGSNLTIDKVEFVKLDEKVIVYNFTVADFHTYYVTNIGVWVHNTNCQLKTIVEETNVTNQLKNLSAKQQESFENIKTQLASGDYTGLNVHALTGNLKGKSSADFKGFGGGRGNARIYFRIEEEKVIITDIVKQHQ